MANHSSVSAYNSLHNLFRDNMEDKP